MCDDGMDLTLFSRVWNRAMRLEGTRVAKGSLSQRNLWNKLVLILAIAGGLLGT